MKSGHYGTLLFNSLAQLILHALVVVRLRIPELDIAIMGDDTLQERVVHDRYVSELEKGGCIVKEVIHRKPGENLSFIGFSFSDKVFEPLYKDKHLYKSLYLNDAADDTIGDYMAIHFQSNSMSKLFRRYLTRHRLPCYSTAYYNAWVFGLE